MHLPALILIPLALGVGPSFCLVRCRPGGGWDAARIVRRLGIDDYRQEPSAMSKLQTSANETGSDGLRRKP